MQAVKATHLQGGRIFFLMKFHSKSQPMIPWRLVQFDGQTVHNKEGVYLCLESNKSISMTLKMLCKLAPNTNK